MNFAGLLAAGGAVGVLGLVAAWRWHHASRGPNARLLATSVGWAALLAALVLFDLSVPHLVNAYVWQILIKVGIYVTLAVSLNIINGIAGQFSMGHAGFMAVGAYTAAYLTMALGAGSQGWTRYLPWNAPWTGFARSGTLASLPWGLGAHIVFLLSLVAGGIAAAIAGYLVGIPSLRLKGDYLAIVTLGFGEIIRNLIANVDTIGASRGLPGVPHYSTLFWVFLFAAISIFVSYRLLASAPGRAMLAVREDEVAAAAMGIDTTRTKIQAFAIGTFFAGVAGGLLGHHYEYLHPDYFKFDTSFEIIIIVVLGGMGSVSGAAVAAVLIAIAPEALRYAKDLLGNLAEPSVLYAAAPFILFSAIFVILFAADTAKMTGRGARGLFMSLRMRAGQGLAPADIARLRASGGRTLTSRIPGFFEGRPAVLRDAGIGAFAGLAAGILHRTLGSAGAAPALEYALLVFVGIVAGALVGRARDRRSSASGGTGGGSAAGPTSPRGFRRLAAVGLLTPPALALAWLLERNGQEFLARASVSFRAFPDPRMVLYSLMLIVLMLTRPTGLFGTNEITVWWRDRRGPPRGAR